ncbi:MAG: putative glutamate N-acetyltransferase precursor [Piptocephalis tieghemiana]|nr:MAG: putative glutamate N-acetyltransferase precursor [Piptocephalis tieghemiana]
MGLQRPYSSASAPTPSKAHLVQPGKEEDYPKGFRLAGIHCGVKKSLDPDLALLVSDSTDTSAAAVFTQNVFAAAPVLRCKEVLQAHQGLGVRGVVVNSGCANAVTGAQGERDALDMAQTLDRTMAWESSPSSTSPRSLVMSTGVIGQNLPIQSILKGIPKAASTLATGHKAWSAAAEAIRTTDTFPKLRAKSFTLPSGRTYRLAGMAKGAGMIHPNMATMLGILATDAAISPAALQQALSHACDRSFNAITVDGDTSTNDTLSILANGAAWSSDSTTLTPLETSEADFPIFQQQLTDFSAELAQLIVRDGEGATKFVTVHVTDASTFAQAKEAAMAIATSSLVKTALYGQDANWGRILSSIGASGVPMTPKAVSVSFLPANADSPIQEELRLLHQGEPAQVDESKASAMLAQEDIVIRVSLGAGKEDARVWTCDLTHGYISINADYRS